LNKKIKFITALLSFAMLTTMAYAITRGTYAGLGLGVSRVETPSQSLIAGRVYSKSQTTDGLGFRIFTGYNINNHLAIETNYAKYAQSKYSINVKNTDKYDAVLLYNLITLDLLAKAYMPLSDTGFELYGLAGAARVSSSVKSSENSNVFSYFENGTKNSVRIRPVYGLGVSYDTNQKVSTGIELKRTQGIGEKGTVPDLDMVTFSISYNFS